MRGRRQQPQQQQPQQPQQQAQQREHGCTVDKLAFEPEDKGLLALGQSQGLQNREQQDEQHETPNRQRGQQQKSLQRRSAEVGADVATTEEKLATPFLAEMSEDEIRWEWYQTGQEQNFEEWSASLPQDHPCRRAFRAQPLMSLPKQTAETVVLSHAESAASMDCHAESTAEPDSIQPDSPPASEACATMGAATLPVQGAGAESKPAAPTTAGYKQRKQEWYREKYGGKVRDLRADEPRRSMGRSRAAAGRWRSVSAPPAYGTAAQAIFSPLKRNPVQSVKKRGIGLDSEMKLQKLARLRFADLPRVDDVLPPLY